MLHCCKIGMDLVGKSYGRIRCVSRYEHSILTYDCADGTCVITATSTHS